MTVPFAFLSYAHADRGLAAQVVVQLRQREIPIWWDEDLDGGLEFRDTLHAQVKSAHAVLVLWTENSVESRFVRNEAAEAAATKKLVALKSSTFDPAQIPFGLREQHVHIATDVDKTVAALARLGVVPAPGHSLTVRLPTTRRRRVPFIIVVTVGVIGSALGLSVTPDVAERAATLRCGLVGLWCQSPHAQLHATIMRDVTAMMVKMGEDAGKPVRYVLKKGPKVLVACIDHETTRPRRWNSGTEETQMFWFESAEGQNSCTPNANNPRAIAFDSACPAFRA
jgi:hypothetical protein